MPWPEKLTPSYNSSRKSWFHCSIAGILPHLFSFCCRAPRAYFVLEEKTIQVSSLSFSFNPNHFPLSTCSHRNPHINSNRNISHPKITPSPYIPLSPPIPPSISPIFSLPTSRYPIQTPSHKTNSPDQVHLAYPSPASTTSKQRPNRSATYFPIAAAPPGGPTNYSQPETTPKKKNQKNRKEDPHLAPHIAFHPLPSFARTPSTFPFLSHRTRQGNDNFMNAKA